MRWSFSTPADQHDARARFVRGGTFWAASSWATSGFPSAKTLDLSVPSSAGLSRFFDSSAAASGAKLEESGIRKYDHCRHPKNQGKKRRRILALVHHRGDGLRRRQIGKPASLLFNEWLRNYGRQVHRHVTWFCTFFFFYFINPTARIADDAAQRGSSGGRQTGRSEIYCRNYHRERWNLGPVFFNDKNLLLLPLSLS